MRRLNNNWEFVFQWNEAFGRGEGTAETVRLPHTVREIMLGVMGANAKVLTTPDKPFARVSGGTNEAMVFTVRAWCKNADYWAVYFDLTQGIIEALGEAGVKAPAVRVLTESK